MDGMLEDFIEHNGLLRFMCHKFSLMAGVNPTDYLQFRDMNLPLCLIHHFILLTLARMVWGLHQPSPIVSHTLLYLNRIHTQLYGSLINNNTVKMIMTKFTLL